MLWKYSSSTLAILIPFKHLKEIARLFLQTGSNAPHLVSSCDNIYNYWVFLYLQIWSVAASVLNKQSWSADRRWRSSLWVGWEVNNPTPQKIVHVLNYLQVPQKWTDSLAWSKHQQMDMRFCMWNVRSLYSACSLKMVARELVIRMDLREAAWGVWSGSSWLRVGSDGGLL
jgi:hypothetical protein